MATQANGKGKGAAKAAKGKTAVGSGENKKTNGSVSTGELTAEPLAEYSSSSKPDREVYNQEQDAIKSAIAIKQAQLDKVKAKIADSTGAGPLGEKRKTLRAEQQELRAKTAGFKTERNVTLDQIKALQEGVSKKIKDMQNAKSKTSYKSTSEIDTRIKDLERQVDTGAMRLVDEKRALSEISELRKARKNFDSFGSQQDSIDADKARLDELRAKLDNPEYKGLQDRYTAIQAELDGINKDLDESNASRDKLYDERNALNAEVNALYARKKESAGNFKEANDRYYTKMNEDRAKRIERQQTERRAYEETKRKEQNEKLLEEARLPAFGREIEDCATLINYFSRFSSGATSVPEPTLSTVAKDSPAGVPKLELRQIESDLPAGATLMKKKGEQQDDFFALSGAKGKGKKGGAGKKQPAAEAANASSQALNVPFQTVAALLQFNISAPLSREDVPKTVDALKEKKQWFEENNDRVTKERIAQAEERIAKAEAKAHAATPGASNDDATVDADESGTDKATMAPVEEVAALKIGDGGADAIANAEA